MIEVLKELAEYGLAVAVVYFAAILFFRRRKSGLSTAFERRKLLALVLLTLAVTAIKVSEDVLSDETGPIDKGVLLYIHRNVPSSLTAFFQAVTFTLKTAMDSRKRTQRAQEKDMGNHAAFTQRVSACSVKFQIQLRVSAFFAFFCGKSHRRI